MGPAPEWWRPGDMAGVRGMEVVHNDHRGGYTWYYSESAGRVYVFWFRT
jgi:hypothetical protein